MIIILDSINISQYIRILYILGEQANIKIQFHAMSDFPNEMGTTDA